MDKETFNKIKIGGYLSVGSGLSATCLVEVTRLDLPPDWLGIACAVTMTVLGWIHLWTAADN